MAAVLHVHHIDLEVEVWCYRPIPCIGHGHLGLKFTGGPLCFTEHPEATPGTLPAVLDALKKAGLGVEMPSGFP